eukprot:SAG31_NODE_25077_length_468_cov_0.975610_1_plen_44_part_01
MLDLDEDLMILFFLVESHRRRVWNQCTQPLRFFVANNAGETKMR